MKTLNGVFLSPKPMKRNFIQENVRQLRDSQKYWLSQDGNEPLVQVPKSKLQKGLRSQPLVSLPSQITSGSKIRQSEQLNGSTNIRNTKSVNVATRKPSPIKQSKHIGFQEKYLKQGRKVKTKLGLKKEKEDEALKRNDVAFYVQQQSDSVLHQQNGIGSYSDSNLSLNFSSSDSVEFFKSPAAPVTQRTIASQTVDPSNLDTLYREGTIRYPSATLKQPISKTKVTVQNEPLNDIETQMKKLDISKSLPVKTRPVLDSRHDENPKLQLNKYSNSEKLDLEHLNHSFPESSDVRQENDTSTNFIHMNAKAISSTTPRTAMMRTDPLKPPATYQRGVLPKYLKKRQGEWQKDSEQKEKDAPDLACPPGHVSLPDPERKETLKMLRKSYADLVHELNMLPVRTDTLRVRQRKMELEKQLNKLEEGIKVFSRPKVYVKIGE